MSTPPASDEKVFWICVVNGDGKGLKGVRVLVRQVDRTGATYDGNKYPSVQGLTDANGWLGFKCNYSFKAEVYLDNKGYGNYWCENGVTVSIKK